MIFESRDLAQGQGDVTRDGQQSTMGIWAANIDPYLFGI